MVVRQEWEEVRSRLRYVAKEIDPIKLLFILERGKVLTERDCESIVATCNNNGPIHATEFELLVRLKKRGPSSFWKFVAALREAGFGHVAQLLDPKFKVTDRISNEMRDERVLEAGVAADLRVKICLNDATEEQVKEVEIFCERYTKSHAVDAVELRKHFSDFLDENVRQFVNLVKTTSSKKTPLIFIFRFSNIDAAEAFWEDYRSEKLKSTIEEKLRSFSDEDHCFKDEEIKFEIVVDEDDYKKVYHTLRNPEECKVLVDGMDKKELKLHDYQHELVKPALDGKNTIVCAPTGSGKTFVAMEAIKKHVESPDHRYIAFIVPTVSLVEQQRSCLEQYLPESIEVSGLCGSNPDISLPSVLKDSHVVVLTAQVLLNALTRKKNEASCSEQGENEVSISQFSLLVFDECHHTYKGHPYNDIMRWYMREKYSEASSPRLPQIIGLSASLGIGTGNSGCGITAEDHILGLCANLDVHELQVYIASQITCTNITSISRDRDNLFYETINDVMAEIEKMISSGGQSLNHQRGRQPYENWVVDLCKQDLGRDIMTCAEQLQFYNSSLMINDEIRCEDALRYLEENITSEESTEVELKLREIFVEAIAVIKKGLNVCKPNAGLQKLENLLREKLSCGGGDGLQSKGIIFVGKRFVAKALVDWLENSEALKNVVKKPTSVIGCGQRRGEGGMPKARQDHEIKSFREGDCNVIVATSALLEGIDIPNCNFAINYSMPGNEITFMQARGRVRTHDDVSGDYTYYIFVTNEQRMSKERDLEKEKLMRDVVAKVKKMSKSAFEEKVGRLQRRAYKEYTDNLARKGSNRTEPVPDDVEFRCRKCNVFACKAKHIKTYANKAHHIVPNYQVNLHNAKFVEDGSPKYMPGNLNQTAKMQCATCGRHWGNRARNEYGEFPLIKISGFRIKSSSGAVVKKEVCSKWKEFPYELEEFDPDNDVNADATDSE